MAAPTIEMYTTSWCGYCERARQLLGWKPTRALDEIVGSAWAWHAAHPDGVEAGEPSF